MEHQAISAAQRDASAALYLEEQEARLLAVDVGLDLTLIPFSTRARANWHQILAAAPPSIIKCSCCRCHQSIVSAGLMG